MQTSLYLMFYHLNITEHKLFILNSVLTLRQAMTYFIFEKKTKQYHTMMYLNMFD